MNLYRYSIRLLSSTGSFWQSDTLFGHLCWQVIRRDGEAGLKEFLEPFFNGEPPFVLSDGFPHGRLPKPLFHQSHRERAESLEEYEQSKRLKRARYVTIAQFRALIHGDPPEGELPLDDWIPFEMLHASIDRNTARTGGAESEGSLFQTISYIPPGDIDRIDIYARATPGGKELFASLLKELSAVGFGKDKSVGQGHFTFDSATDITDLDETQTTNGFVSISSYVPAESDPVTGFWVLRTKRGKLGEELAQSADPFKRALIQLEPGAVFKTIDAPHQFYGRIVRGIAPAFPPVIQNCQTVAIPCRMI
jgi:CRISPR-associated protein Csm4